MHDPAHKGQYAISTTLSDLAKMAHLRIDDVAFTLSELGFLKHRQKPSLVPQSRRRNEEIAEEEGAEEDDVADEEGDLGEWSDVEVVIKKEMVEEMWEKWRVRENGVLDESCVLL